MILRSFLIGWVNPRVVSDWLYSDTGVGEIHSKTRKYSCRLCYAKFKQNSVLRAHLKKMHQSQEEIEFLKNGSDSDLSHNCGSCDRKFVTEDLLTAHSNREHSKRLAENTTVEEDEQLSCQFCQHVFKRKWNLRRHMQDAHSNIETKDGQVAPMY